MNPPNPSTAVAGGHFDAFIHFDEIKGESTDSKFKDEIELLSFDHTVQQAASTVASSSGGASAGRVEFGRFIINKQFDIASPKLMEYCVRGKHIANVWVKMRRSGGDQHEFYRMEFKDVMITSIHKTAGMHGGETLPTERIEFVYSTYGETYTKQSRQGGGQSGSIGFGWDLNKNAPSA